MELQPVEILEMITNSLDPQYNIMARLALRHTSRTLMRKIKWIPMAKSRSEDLVDARPPESVESESDKVNEKLARHLLQIGVSYEYILKYKLVNPTGIFTLVIQAGRLDLVMQLRRLGSTLDKNVCMHAAAYGQLACLTYAYTRATVAPRKLHKATAKAAARNGHINVLRFLLSEDATFYASAADEAAYYGQFEFLRFFHENCLHLRNVSTTICSNAALNGHLACLQFAHENGAPWDYNTCAEAANGGHLDCLSYAHSNGCDLDQPGAVPSWHYNTCQHAANAGSVDCLRYAHQNGIKLNWHVVRSAFEGSTTGHVSCQQYLKSQGYAKN